MSDALDRAIAASLSRHLRSRRLPCPERLAESIRYSLLAPGKRIRPRLLIASGRMQGLKQGQVLPAAIALEMIHCFSLIHDDLPCMDDDDFRRGRPSNHKAFGEATALLAGDALLCLAFETILDCAERVAPKRALAAATRLARATGACGMTGGQAAEGALTAASPFSDLLLMHAGKTGALFEAALLLPGDLSGLDFKSARGRSLERFARVLGAAFQVVDDLEDSEQDRASGSEDLDPTSILRHVTRNQAISTTARDLSKAQRDLSRAWGKRANPLVRISEEVGARLK